MLSRRTVNLGILASVGLAAGVGRVVAADLEVIDLPSAMEGRRQAPRPSRVGSALDPRIRRQACAVLPTCCRTCFGRLAASTARRRGRPHDAVVATRHRTTEIFVAAADARGGTTRGTPADAGRSPRTSGPRPACRISLNRAALPYLCLRTAPGCEGAEGDDKRVWAFTDTGFIGQNVYLFCASEGLARCSAPR